MRGLTVIDESLEYAEKSTAPGMAHWAGGAPNGETCGKCKFYGYSYVQPDDRTISKRSSCQKFWKMTGRHGSSLEARQSGCKYFGAKAS